MGRALECWTERGSIFCDVPMETTMSEQPDHRSRSGWRNITPERSKVTRNSAGLLSWCSRNGSTELRMPLKMSESSRDGAARRRKRSCAATPARCSNWQSASALILRDARLRRAPQDEGLSKPLYSTKRIKSTPSRFLGHPSVCLHPLVKSRRFRGDDAPEVGSQILQAGSWSQDDRDRGCGDRGFLFHHPDGHGFAGAEQRRQGAGAGRTAAAAAGGALLAGAGAGFDIADGNPRCRRAR